MNLATRCIHCLWQGTNTKSHHYKKRQKKRKNKVEYRNICISRHGEAMAGVPVFSLISSFSPLYLPIHRKGGEGKNSSSFLIFISYIPFNSNLFSPCCQCYHYNFDFLHFFHYMSLFCFFCQLSHHVVCFFHLDLVAGYSPSCFRYQPRGDVWIFISFFFLRFQLYTQVALFSTSSLFSIRSLFMASPCGGSREMAQALDCCHHGDDWTTRLGQAWIWQKGGQRLGARRMML